MRAALHSQLEIIKSAPVETCEAHVPSHSEELQGSLNSFQVSHLSSGRKRAPPPSGGNAGRLPRRPTPAALDVALGLLFLLFPSLPGLAVDLRGAPALTRRFLVAREQRSGALAGFCLAVP